MKIAYCEDEPAQRSRMEILLRTFAERKRLPLTVEAFSDSAAFLFQYPGSAEWTVWRWRGKSARRTVKCQFSF